MSPWHAASPPISSWSAHGRAPSFNHLSFLADCCSACPLTKAVAGVEEMYMGQARFHNQWEHREHPISVFGLDPQYPMLNLPGVRRPGRRLGTSRSHSVRWLQPDDIWPCRRHRETRRVLGDGGQFSTSPHRRHHQRGHLDHDRWKPLHVAREFPEIVPRSRPGRDRCRARATQAGSQSRASASTARFIRGAGGEGAHSRRTDRQ